MGLETGNYVADLVITNPPGTDPKSQGDDHLRLIKTTLRNTFPGFTGTAILTGIDSGAANAYVLTPTTPLLAYSAGMVVEFVAANSSTAASTINISGLGAKSILSVDGVALTVSDILAGQPVLLLYDGTNFRLSAITKRYADQLAFSATLPNQAGNGGRLLGTDGTNANWTNLINAGVMRLADSVDTTKRVQFVLSGISTGQTRTATFPDRNLQLGVNLVYEARSSGTNTQLVAADFGKYIDITTGTFTQTFDAAANLGNGWAIRLRNSGGGNITLDPNATELIDGLTSYIMYPGEIRDISCDGTKFVTGIFKPYRVRFTAGGTWTKPPGYSEHGGEVGSGGASGVRSGGAGLAQGGPGGGVFPFQFPDAQLGATETITVGAGGVAQSGAAAGNDGGNSSFGSWVLVIGGHSTTGTGGNASRGGAVSLVGTTALNDGVAVVGVGYNAVDAAASVHSVWAGGKADNNAAAVSGNSQFGGGAGGSVDGTGTLRAAGTSKRGGNGGAAGDAVNGTAGTFPCGGGGATRTGTSSGAGANGYIDVWGIV